MHATLQITGCLEGNVDDSISNFTLSYITCKTNITPLKQQQFNISSP